VPSLDLRLRVTSPELLALPWRRPLADWDVTAVPIRDIPVGPSRHLVRFVEADGRLWALKDLPARVAAREYDVLREMENRSLPAVRATGVVTQPDAGNAILVTEFLERSWQYRRLLMRVPASQTTHRGRLFDAMAALLVDLHRNGIYWGDCSLANTLFTRDGQIIQAWLVDAETAEFHPSLSAGQRDLDLEIMRENVAGGLLDVAARRDEPPEVTVQVFDEVASIIDRYEQLWLLLHDEPVLGLSDQHQIDSRLRRLNDLGFAVEEVRLEGTTAGGGGADAIDRSTHDPPDDAVRMKVAVAGRRFHANQLVALTGLDVGEGQATILLNDLREYQRHLQRESGMEVPEQLAARHWVMDRFTPGVDRAHAAVGGRGDPIQAYCDLLEVRWLLSEEAGRDVGDEAALEVIAQRSTPGDSAANLAFVDLATEELPALTPELIAEMSGGSDPTGDDLDELDGLAPSPTIDLRDLDDDRG
jgi:hypothetical protein